MIDRSLISRAPVTVLWVTVFLLFFLTRVGWTEEKTIKIKLIAPTKNDGDKSGMTSMSHWLNQMTPRIRITMAEIKVKTEKIGSGMGGDVPLLTLREVLQ